MIGVTMVAKVSLGAHPFGMKRAVSRPQAMNAPMLGMIIPARWPPKRWMRARKPLPSRFLLTRASGRDMRITLSDSDV